MKYIYAFVLMVICQSANAQEYKNLPLATDSTYGYTLDNPIRFKRKNVGNNIASSHELIRRLVSSNYERLILIRRSSMKGKSSNRITFVDKYMLRNSETGDTIYVYIDCYHKGIPMVPTGLKLLEL